MNIDDMTIGEAKQIASMFGSQAAATNTIQGMGREKVIVRTYSAGVWFGEIVQKAGKEVIIKNARRLWYWKAKQSISLSGVAKYGLDDKSRIAPAVDLVWLEAIELIPVSKEVAENIEGQPDAKAE